MPRFEISNWIARNRNFSLGQNGVAPILNWGRSQLGAQHDCLIRTLNEIGLWQNETLPKDLMNLIPPLFNIAYSFNSYDVLEYTYKPAKHRLYYDKQNVKDPGSLWLKAVELLSEKGKLIYTIYRFYF